MELETINDQATALFRIVAPTLSERRSVNYQLELFDKIRKLLRTEPGRKEFTAEEAAQAQTIESVNAARRARHAELSKREGDQ